VIITDYRLPGIDGLMFLSELRKKSPGVPVVMLTAFGTIEMAVEAMKTVLQLHFQACESR